jgi:hypothetical protein
METPFCYLGKVKGKQVILRVDGGRTRTRVENGKLSPQMNKCYYGAWKEPKLFVIDIIDQDGHLFRIELPIYGARFGEEEVLELLEKTLRSLQIEEATEVQIVDDGAVWISQNVKSLLLKPGVEESKITETLGCNCGLSQIMLKKLKTTPLILSIFLKIQKITT